MSVLQRRLDLGKDRLSQTEDALQSLRQSKAADALQHERQVAAAAEQLSAAEQSAAEARGQVRLLQETHTMEKTSLSHRCDALNDALEALKKIHTETVSRVQLLEEQNAKLNESLLADRSSLLRALERCESLENKAEHDELMSFERTKELEDKLDDANDKINMLEKNLKDAGNTVSELTLSLSVSESLVQKSKDDVHQVLREVCLSADIGLFIYYMV